tara:strand:- start:148 stop:561 length:414 start_codon:yes stop_codon:yes gene_type:complete
MTDDHTYFVFKLVSGEEIVAVTRIDDTGVEPAFFLTKPLKVELTHKGTNTLVRLIPWITIPEDDTFRVGFDKIITMTELEEDHEMIHAYTHYNLNRDNKDTHKVRISEKMGYKGNVEDVRTRLEKIYSAPVGITTTV